MDKNAYFRSDTVGPMSANFQSTALQVGPMLKSEYVEVIIPSIVSGDSIIVSIAFSDSATINKSGGETFFKSLNAAGRYLYPFFTNKAYASILMNCTNAATATALAFGNVSAKIVPAGYDAMK